MKYSLAVVFALLLAACGGGGSGGGGTIPSGTPPPRTTSPPTPTPTPTRTQYASKLVFVGALAGHSMQSELRRIESGSSIEPIMVVSPMTAQGNIGNAFGIGTYGGTVYVQVSPQPSTTPAVTFSQTDPNAIISPAPSPSPSALPSGDIAAAGVSSNGTIDAQSAGTATAAIGDPVNATVSTLIYTYRAIALECVQPANPGASPGWQWDGSSWVAVSDPAQADIYLSGSRCPGLFATSTSDTIVNYPAGGVRFSTDTPFYTLTAAQWTNAETSAGMQTLAMLNPDGSQNTELIAKTNNGAIFKLFPNAFGAVPGEFSGAVVISGVSPDGF